MKKLLSLLVAAAMSFTLVGCSSSSDDDTAADTSDIKVAMITDSGDITDQSFNQTTYEAAKAYCEGKEIDFNYYKPSDDSDDARIQSIETAIDEGYNVIVMPGYLFGPAICQTSQDYEDVKFIGIDVSESDVADGYNEANTYLTVYQEQIPGYMAGYAAVKMGYTKLGFLGGMSVPAVMRYGYGYVQGADAAAKELGVDVSINYVYGGQFYGDSDITSRMDTWYKGGTEVVFACGGGIYTSACEAAAKVKGKVIGVDVDQQAQIDDTYGEGMCVASAKKDLTNTVNTLLQSVVDGTFDSDYAGKIDNLGLTDDTDYVGLSYVTSDSWSDDDYSTLLENIRSGKVEISSDTENEPKVSISVDYQGSIK